MNTQQLIAASLIAFAGTTAFAQEATSDAWMQVNSTQSRDAVKAQVAQARADGTLQTGGEATVTKQAPVAAEKSRAQVQAEGRAKVSRAPQIDEYNIGA